jgi:restriction system protein
VTNEQKTKTIEFDDEEYIIVNDIDDLEEWASLFTENGNIWPNMCFPNEKIRKQYLEIVKLRPESEIMYILVQFIVHAGTREADKRNLDAILKLGNSDLFEKALKTQHYLRMMRGEPAFEGITWVLDLLQLSPKGALDVIDYYIAAEAQHLGDYMWDGLLDSQSIIRTRFIEYSHPIELLHSLGGRGFEELIASLYREMGYDVALTKKTRNGGVDVVALSSTPARKDKKYIQCKCTSGKVPVGIVRELYGVISDDKIPSGVVVSLSGYTSEAIKFAERNAGLELLDGQAIIRLLNSYFGADWPTFIDYIRKQHTFGVQ